MAEDEIIKKHTKAVYKTWRDPDKKWPHKLKEIVVEVLIIVFAVTISIWFHNLAESAKEHREEKEFYRGLSEDLRADIKEMVSDRDYLKELERQTQYLMKAATGMPASSDSLMIYSSVCFTQAQISPRISRFEALKGSGKLDIIENKKNQYDITDLYQKTFPYLVRTNETFNALTIDKMVPSLGDLIKLDTSGQFINMGSVIQTSKIRLYLMQLKGNAENCVRVYDTAINQSNRIIKEITTEIH